MESLNEEPWDVVICGTGLQQSLLALALSRSKKRVLHVDPNDYYGEHEAAFSLQEAESWVARSRIAGDGDGDGNNKAAGKDTIFRDASIWKHEEATSLGLSYPRAYALALAPQIIHTRSKLLEQLVSSKAFRQVEFLAVGSFFVYDGADATKQLSRIPSSREEVFLTKSIPARAKRSLMKFLKFVVGEYGSEEHAQVWEGHAKEPLAGFLAAEFGLDETLRKYILALTLSLDDGNVTVEDGLAAIHRHLASMGVFGPGFCAVYPKWGGLSEIAQVACRAGAVGGGIYMLGTDMQVVEDGAGAGDNDGRVSIKLSNDITVQTSTVVTSQQELTSPGDGQAIDRLVAVVNSPLRSLFEPAVEGAPIPAVAVVAFPPGPVTTGTGTGDDDNASPPTNPVYAFVHSSDTGECPSGQSVVYLTTPASSTSHQTLERALGSLLQAVASPSDDNETPSSSSSSPVIPLFKLRYVQSVGSSQATSDSGTRSFSFPPPLLSLAFDDSSLDAVKAAWKLVVKDDVPVPEDHEYMLFEDREGVGGGGIDDDMDD